jgi:hypothetical protein
VSAPGVPPDPRSSSDAPRRDIIDPPPFLGRWTNLYLLVVLALVAIILALLWLTRSFE